MSLHDKLNTSMKSKLQHSDAKSAPLFSKNANTHTERFKNIVKNGILNH